MALPDRTWDRDAVYLFFEFFSKTRENTRLTPNCPRQNVDIRPDPMGIVAVGEAQEISMWITGHYARSTCVITRARACLNALRQGRARHPC